MKTSSSPRTIRPSSGVLRILGAAAAVPVLMLTAGLGPASATSHGTFHVWWTKYSLVCDGTHAVSAVGNYQNTTAEKRYALASYVNGTAAYQLPFLDSGAPAVTDTYNFADLGISQTRKVYTLNVTADMRGDQRAPGRNILYNTCLGKPAVARSDSRTVMSGVRTRINALDNDSGGAMLNEITQQPSHGRLVIKHLAGGAGAFFYVSDKNYVGPDNWAYNVVSSGTSRAVSEPATDSITVTAATEKPTVYIVAAPPTVSASQPCTTIHTRIGNAKTATKTGDWSGLVHLNRHGEQVCPDGVGDHVYGVTANGDGGTTSGSVTVKVTSAPAPKAVQPSPAKSVAKAPTKVTKVAPVVHVPVVKSPPAHNPVVKQPPTTVTPPTHQPVIKPVKTCAYGKELVKVDGESTCQRIPVPTPAPTPTPVPSPTPAPVVVATPPASEPVAVVTPTSAS